MQVLEKPNLDPHLLLKLISIEESKGQPLPNEMKFLKIGTLAKTRKFKELQEAVDSIREIGFPKLRDNLKEAEEQTNNRADQLEDDDVLGRMKDLEDDCDSSSKEVVELFQDAYELARIRYEQGRYQDALDLLIELDYFVEDYPLWIPTTWGKLCCEILLEKWNKVRDTAKRLKFKIDDYRFASVQKALSQKQSLLSTCLFIFFQTGEEQDLEIFIDYLTDEDYFSTIQMVCPWMLRYLTAAMLLNKTYQRYGNFDLYRLVDSLNRNLFRYSDSIVEFIKELLIKFNFKNASEKLKDVEKELANDPFLCKLLPKIIDSSQTLFYETYCKIYETLKVSDVALFLNRNEDEAELWIVSLIRRAGINVKVDSSAGIIRVVKSAGRNTNELKLSELVSRTNTLVNNLSRIVLQG